LTLTAFVGALVALLPRPERPVQIPVESEVERLTKENARLQRSQARLVDHIERLEREILLEQHLTTHWRETAQRIVKQAREAREAFDREREQLQRVGPLWLPEQNLALLQAQGELAQMQAAQQAQCAQAQAQQNQNFRWRGDYEGFCNCVPSRSQVWEANRGEG
jgi:hypothetical protein